MLDKKAEDYGLLIHTFIAIILLVLIFIVFTFLFGFLGMGKSPNQIIRAEYYQDSSKIITLVSSPTQIQENNKNLTIAELISLASTDEIYKSKLDIEISKLMKTLPKTDKIYFSWNLNIQTNDKTLINIGEETIASTNYSMQKINIPIKNKEIAKVILYANCLGCKEADVNAIA